MTVFRLTWRDKERTVRIGIPVKSTRKTTKHTMKSQDSTFLFEWESDDMRGNARKRIPFTPIANQTSASLYIHTYISQSISVDSSSLTVPQLNP